MAAAYYDFFRKILLQPDGTTLEADSVEDTLTITSGNGVAFNPNAATDSFTIDVDYQLYVPVGTTEIRLNDVNSNHSGISINPGNNIAVTRNSNNELVITSTVGGTSKAIGGLTQASPGVVTTTSAHGFTEGIAVTITDVGGMTQVNGNEYYMDILTSNTFALYTDSNLAVPLDTTGFDAYTTGGVATAEYAAPQALNQLNDVSLVELPVAGDFLQFNGTYWGKGTDINGTFNGDLSGSVFADDSTLIVDGVNGTIPWAVVNGTPTTLAGYGITDSATFAQGALADSALQSVAFTDLTTTPTTLAGYGITDAQVAGAPYDGDITGSVFGDDSTLLVDGVNGNIPLSVISELNGQAVRIGSRAGDQTAANIIAIGSDAGRNAGNQGIAIGRLAGSHGTGGVNTVAIGAGAGYQNQGNQGVAIGYQAGYTDQGNYGIALGFRAGQDLQHDNTIIINADSGVSSLDSEGTSRFYVNPIRSAAMTTILGYDATTKEVTHNAAIPGYISLADLKTEVAASADFAAFKIRIAAL